MTLTDFLLARIAEDEAVAKATVAAGDPAPWSQDNQWELSGPVDGPAGYSSIVVEPARVLAECEAKRARLRLADDIEGEADDDTYHWGRSIAERIRKIKALPYADHPDYREEWKP